MLRPAQGWTGAQGREITTFVFARPSKITDFMAYRAVVAYNFGLTMCSCDTKLSRMPSLGPGEPKKFPLN